MSDDETEAGEWVDGPTPEDEEDDDGTGGDELAERLGSQRFLSPPPEATRYYWPRYEEPAAAGGEWERLLDLMPETLVLNEPDMAVDPVKVWAEATGEGWRSQWRGFEAVAAEQSRRSTAPPEHYDKEGRPIAFLEWRELREDPAYRVVATRAFARLEVRTQWTGRVIGGQGGEDYYAGLPLIFETVVDHFAGEETRKAFDLPALPGGQVIRMSRWTTLHDALAGHGDVVRILEWMGTPRGATGQER